jgi:transposase
MKKRAAILKLYTQGHAIRFIARRIQASRNTVRSIIRSGTTEVPLIVRRTIAEDYRTQILDLYRHYRGNVSRVHEELIAHGAHISYAALTGFVRRNGIRQTTPYLHPAMPHVPNAVIAARVWLAELTYGWQPTNLFQADPKERRELASLLDFVRDGNLRDRKKAATILARKAGWPNEIIAKIVHATRPYTRRYFKVYSESGLQGLFAPSTPRPSRVAIDTEKANRILALLHCRPDSLGFNRMSWTKTDLVQAYKERHREGISINKVSILIKRLGYGWRKARRVLTSPDPNYREKAELLWNTLRALSESELLFYCDEWGPVQVNRRGGRAYRLKGSVPRIPRHQVSKGTVSLVAALSATTNQITWLFVPSKDSESMIRLLETLYNQYHDNSKLYITWDAVSWHNSVSLTQWVDEFNAGTSGERRGPRIELVPLPTSAQFLNAIEGVFSGMTRAVINNSDYKCPEDMKAAISRHFNLRNQYYAEHPTRAGNKIWNPSYPDFNVVGSEGGLP